MASVENRIVQMQFDNTGFERRLSDTLQSLDKLNQSIANTGAKNGLQQVADSAKSFNLGPVAASIDGVSAKFLAMSTIAITALSNIVGRAVDAGISLAKSLSLDQVTAGFREYELQIGSIQTILANTSAKGTNLEQVNAALDELNTYSDKTIYNFGEMTRNIGTFTSAGVDLDLSVQSIKGIANLAAISGSNSQQASTAMYQLSQAIATGSVKLMDWNSVVNAGMGGEVFQKALFDTGKMMGKITDSPVGQTFEQWTDAGNSFRGSLEKGWLTADVLTTTLQGFTGELTEAQILSMGYTAEQAKEIMRLGELGVDSATKVRTLSQLIDTTKEAISSGWAQSFRTIFGDFEEATSLFTGISDALGGIVGRSADARNALLEGWAALGGRDVLIKGFENALRALGAIIAPIKEAFREIFPPMTAERLFDLTQGFADLMERMKPSERTIENIKRIFKGFFSVLEIGWTVIKSGVGFIKDLFTALTGAGSGGFLELAAKVGDFFTALNEGLVEGKGIEGFFKTLSEAIKSPIEFIKDLKDKIVDFFSSIGSGGMDAAGDAVGRFGERFEGLRGIIDRLKDIWEPFGKALSGIAEILDKVWDTISTWFSELGGKLADVFGPGDFNTVLDALNVGLLGGIGLMLKKFVDGGLKLDLGDGFFAGITESFQELTGVLSAMQADIKANALLKIAGALTLLTVAVILLSTVDSEALSKALTAMAIGFGQLVGVFVSLNKVVIGPGSAAKLTLLSGGLILLSTSMLILAAAVKILSSMGWEDMIKGLLGTAALLGMIVLVAGPLGLASAGLIRAGIGMAAIGVGLMLLGGAMKIFAGMSWDEIGQGLFTVASGLVMVAAGMKLMPPGLAVAGVGIFLISAALNVLALAMKQFASMSLDDIGKGLFSVAGGLVMVAAGMRLMPPSMIAMGAGLILVAGSLLLISKALQSFATMTWDEIGQGLFTMASSLVLLGIALKGMTGSIGGAIAVGIAAVSLRLLAEVIKEFAGIPLMELIKGLGGMAAVFVVLGAAAFLIQPLVPALLGLGAALILIGGGFALFGLGAQGVAKAIEILATAGVAGVTVFVEALKMLARALPEIMANFAEGVLEFVKVILKALPTIIDEIVAVLGSLLDGIGELIPKVLVVVGELISGILGLIREKVPEFIETGWAILTAFLAGIRDNIGEVTTMVAEIVTNFLDSFALKIPEMVTSLVGFLTTVLTETARGIGLLAPTLFIGIGTALIDGLWTGIKNEVGKLLETIGGIIRDIIDWFKSGFGIASPSTVMMGIGRNVIVGFLNGVVAAAVAVTQWFIALPGRILGWIGNLASTLIGKGSEIVAGFLTGLGNRIGEVTNWFTSLPGKIVGWIGNLLGTLKSKGSDLIKGLYDGAVNLVTMILIPWVSSIDDKILSAIGNLGNLLYNIGRNIIQGLWNGMKALAGSVMDWVGNLASDIAGAIKNPFGIFSPSRLTTEYGLYIMEGLQRGMHQGAPGVLNEVKLASAKLKDALSGLSMSLVDMDNINPTITPVLDLTQFTKQANIMQNLISERGFDTNASFSHARAIVSTRTEADTPVESTARSGDIRFEQNIFAPQQLSTSDIYKQTRNQIVLAKEELKIP